MAAKLIVLLTLAAAAHCSVLPLAGKTVVYNAPDAISGDNKSQLKTWSGDVWSSDGWSGDVCSNGGWSDDVWFGDVKLDDKKKTVDYEADALNGFYAALRKNSVVTAPGLTDLAPVVTARKIAAPAVVASEPAIVASSVYGVAPAIETWSYNVWLGDDKPEQSKKFVEYEADALKGFNTLVGKNPIEASPVDAARTIAKPAVVASEIAASSSLVAAPATYAARTITGSKIVASAPANVATSDQLLASISYKSAPYNSGIFW